MHERTDIKLKRQDRARDDTANHTGADGTLTGRPGIAFVTRGPGATNASIGVHVAMQDSQPMILFIGDVDRGMKDREGFQEVDFAAMFGPLCKWAARIDEAARIPEYVARAFNVAMSGRPGPVVLALPEDMLCELAEALDRPRVRRLMMHALMHALLKHPERGGAREWETWTVACDIAIDLLSADLGLEPEHPVALLEPFQGKSAAN